jgi:hypothetical protein
MSFTVPLPPRTQLYHRSCSNKHTHIQKEPKNTPCSTSTNSVNVLCHELTTRSCRRHCPQDASRRAASFTRRAAALNAVRAGVSPETNHQALCCRPIKTAVPCPNRCDIYMSVDAPSIRPTLVRDENLIAHVLHCPPHTHTHSRLLHTGLGSSSLIAPHANSFVIGPAVIKHTHSISCAFLNSKDSAR